jgi:hypothetical protein
MRRVGVLWPVLVLLVVAGCAAEPRPDQLGYRVTYTVELLEPTRLGPLTVHYVEGRDTVQAQTPDSVRTWTLDVWVSQLAPAYLEAEIPADTLDLLRDVVGPAVGFPMRCRVAVNGTEVSSTQQDNQCFAQSALYDRPEEPVVQAPATTHPPELWPPLTSTPAPPTSTAPAEPRPEGCRYATDAEITDIVSRSGAGTLLFAGVTTTYPFSCLYRFTPLPTAGAVAAGPFTGVTVIRYPARFAPGDLTGDPVPGLPGAKRSSDHEISGQLRSGALTVQADLGSAFADRNATAEVYRLVRSRA